MRSGHNGEDIVIKKIEEGLTLRQQEEKDRESLEYIVREAFWNIYKPGASEHYILHLAFNHEDTLKDYSFVLEKDGSPIGQILYTRATLKKDNGEELKACSFGPVSIIPSKQKRGYGEYLIRRSLSLLKQSDYDFVLIYGNPTYYKEFGFRPAKDYGILIPHQKKDEDLPFVMALDLCDIGKVSTLDEPFIFKESSLFNVKEEEVEAFDKKFPKKKKEVREGQL